MRPSPVLSFPAPRPATRRILLVDDHGFFSLCLRRLINLEADLEVCDVMHSGAGLHERVDDCRPDALVIDLSTGPGGGYRIGRELRAAGVTTPILFVSTGEGLPSHRLRQLAPAYFATKGGNPAELLRHIRRVSSVQTPVVPAAETFELLPLRALA